MKRPSPTFTCDMAKAITAPTLLSNGARSPPRMPPGYRSVGGLFAEPERIEIAASSHTVPSENPGIYDQAVLAFMAKHYCNRALSKTDQSARGPMLMSRTPPIGSDREVEMWRGGVRKSSRFAAGCRS